MHPQLLALGFVDFYEDMKKVGKIRLFPQLSYVEDSYGRQAGRSFADYLTAIGIDEKEKVYHSFRHTFNDNLKQVALLADEARSELTGHAHKSINSSVYSSEHRLPNKLHFISMLKFDGLLLDHFKYQPGQFDSQFNADNSRALAKKASYAKHLAAKLAREERNQLAGKRTRK